MRNFTFATLAWASIVAGVQGMTISSASELQVDSAAHEMCEAYDGVDAIYAQIDSGAADKKEDDEAV